MSKVTWVIIFLSIHGALAHCGISTSTINRDVEKGTFPPKRKLSNKRVGFWVWQIVEWLNGQVLFFWKKCIRNKTYKARFNQDSKNIRT